MINSKLHLLGNRILILLSVMTMSFAFVACHSSVYNEAMSSARSFERAIDNASSIDELPYYSIFDYNPFEYLEGDEERAVVERMNQLNKKFNTKFEELALLPSSYLLTINENTFMNDLFPSHVGEKYKLELSYSSGKKVAKLYSSNGNLYRNGTWDCELGGYNKERLEYIEIDFERIGTPEGEVSGRLEFKDISLTVPKKEWRGDYYHSPASTCGAYGKYEKSN